MVVVEDGDDDDDGDSTANYKALLTSPNKNFLEYKNLLTNNHCFFLPFRAAGASLGAPSQSHHGVDVGSHSSCTFTTVTKVPSTVKLCTLAI